MMTDIYLMRHGETLFNQLHLIQGACDSPLTDQGLQQTQAARQFFEKLGITFEAAYSSTQERAEDTLETIYAGEYERLKDLKEWNFGVFEGSPEYLNPPRRRPDQVSYEDQFVPYGGEDVKEVAARMNRALTTIAQAHAEQQVLVVSHGGAIYSFYLKWRQAQDKRPSFSNCCILHFKFKDGKFKFIESFDPIKQVKE